MAKSDRGFTDLVAHLKKISNLDYLTEEAQLRNAVNISLPDVPTTKDDITKLAGLKTNLVENKQIIKEDEEGRPNPSNPNPSNIKSSITTAIEETDTSLSGQITKEVMNEEMRLAKIEQLQKQIEELKQQEIQENTYSIEDFREVISKQVKEFIKEAGSEELSELYNLVGDKELTISEDGQSFTINTLQENDEEINEEDTELDEYSDDKEESGFTDKQIKMAFGVLNDPKFKGGNYDGAVEVINKIAPGLSDHPSVKNALMRANEDTSEAHGYEGQDEFHAHTIKLAGDFDAENPVSDADAEAVKQAIIKNSAEQGGRGIVVDVEPAEGAYDSVVVHTMRDREEILGYMGDMVDEGTKQFSNDVEKITEEKKKPKPTKPSLWSRAKAEAKKKFDVYPSAYANAWAAKWYKGKGGGWR